MAKNLVEIIKKPSRRVVGVVSGTSMEGVNAAMVSASGEGSSSKIEVEETHFLPYAEDMRERLLELTNPETATVDAICHLNFVIGEILAEAVLALAKKAKTALDKIDLIGSRGQTTYQTAEASEEGPYSIRSTLQIGEPAVIVDRTGVCTVSDFRTRDIAREGEGAPLVPYADYILFHSDETDRVILNIGGIASVTLLPKRAGFEKVIGFDTGPGNMVLDALSALFFGEEHRFDSAEACASEGEVDEELLEKFLSMPYFRRKPPKSAGRELFGAPFVYYFLKEGEKRKLSRGTLLRTASALTASAIAGSLRENLRSPLEDVELIASGAGARNRQIMSFLSEYLPVAIRLSDDFGIPIDFKESIAFAILANECVSGLSAKVPSVRGATYPLPLGKIIPPAPGKMRRSRRSR